MLLPTVVLPHPDSPTSASVRPGRIASDTPSTARTWPTVRLKIPRRIGKWTFRSRTSRSGRDGRSPVAAAISPGAGASAIAPARSVSRRWQRTSWPSTMRVQPGGSVRHRSKTCSQRSAKRQPANSPESAGTWPAMTSSSVPRLPVPGSAAKSFREYGCCGARKKASRSATSTICPAYITATRCAMPETTPRSWVIRRIDIPRCAWSERSRSSTCAWIVTSSAVVGSSATRSSGSPASASAIMTRCFIPPESWNG